jgi:glutaredoxin
VFHPTALCLRNKRPAMPALMLLALGFAATLVATLAATTPAQAQTGPVFRLVGPDGRVTFTDLPGAGAGMPAAGVAPPAGTAGNSDPMANFPFLLRQAATRHPVVLYTTDNCLPCNQGRQLLVGRGVPFSEKTIATNADVEAFTRLGGGSQVPYLSVGAQAVSGYSQAEWTRLLNNAGYPPNAQLPRTYQAQAPQPLAPTLANTTGVVQGPGGAAATGSGAEPPSAPASPSVPIAPTVAPGGIRF